MPWRTNLSDGGRNGTNHVFNASNSSAFDGEQFYYDPCSSPLMDFQARYRSVYGYLACVLCLVAVLLNATNIVVLTRRHMLSPVNCLLTVVAAAEMVIVGLQLPVSVYFYIMRNEKFMASAAVFDDRQAPLWYHMLAIAISSFCQTVAAWATVAVAVFRYVSICHHVVGERFCTLRNAVIVSAVVVAVAAALSCPSWLVVTVIPADNVSSFPYCLPLAELSGWWTLGFSSIAAESQGLIILSSWLFAITGKVAPAALLAVFTCLLVKAMRRIEQQRASIVSVRRSSSAEQPQESRRSREQRRATRVLLAVVAVWLVVEMPQGVMLALVCAGHQFVYTYELLGDVINTGTLVAMSVNFFLYTSMMRRFRTTFCQTFPKCAYFNRRDKPARGGGDSSLAAKY